MLYLSLKRSWVHFPVNLVTVLWREEGVYNEILPLHEGIPEGSGDVLSYTPTWLSWSLTSILYQCVGLMPGIFTTKPSATSSARPLAKNPRSLRPLGFVFKTPWRAFKILPRESIEYSRESLWGLHSLKIITRVFKNLQISSVIKSLRRSPGDLFTINLEISKKPDHFTVNYSNQAPFYCKHFW